MPKLVKSVGFHYDESFNKYYMLGVLDVCWIKCWNVLLIVMSESKEIRMLDLKERRYLPPWNLEHDAKCVGIDWHIVSFHFCNKFNIFITALTQKKMLLYFINPEFNNKLPEANNNKMYNRKPLRIETVYMSLYMDITSFGGVILNVSESHDLYFWYQVTESVNFSEFQPIEISYKKVEKSWNKIYT